MVPITEKKKKILVTGGAGFIGSHLVRGLLKEGYRVSVIDNLSRNFNNIQDLVTEEKIDFLKGDIRYREHIDMVMEGVDEVFHLAAVCLNRCKAFPKEAIEVNLNGSYNMFGACIRHDVNRIFYYSTASVFGEPTYLPMDEKLPHNAVEPYGATKSCSEKLLTFLSSKHDLSYIIIRPFNVYGSHQNTDAYYTSVINLFIKRLLTGLPPKINGSGEQSMDFTSVVDIVGASLRLLETDIANEDFNVAPGKEISIKDLAYKLIEVMGLEIEPQFMPREVLVTKRRADHSKLNKLTGYEFKTELEVGLRELVEHVRKNIGRY